MLNVAIVGLGMAATPHAESLTRHADRIRVVRAASRTEARTADFARRYGFPVTNDVNAAITDPGVDAVLLLTPPDTHHDLALLAIAHGKHLLIEKPLDTRLDRAEAIVAAAADRAGVRLGVVLQHRFRPGARRLGALIGAGALGSLEGAHLAVPWWRPQTYYDAPGRGTIARDGGGVLMTQAIHSLDLLRSLVGDLGVIASQFRTTRLHAMEGEDHAGALLRMPGGGLATLVASTAFFPGRVETLDLVGTLGSARLEGERLVVHWHDGRTEQVEGDDRSGNGASPMDFGDEAHAALILDFAAAIAEGRAPAVSGEDALATQRLIDALTAAATV